MEVGWWGSGDTRAVLVTEDTLLNRASGKVGGYVLTRLRQHMHGFFLLQVMSLCSRTRTYGTKSSCCLRCWRRRVVFDSFACRGALCVSLTSRCFVPVSHSQPSGRLTHIRPRTLLLRPLRLAGWIPTVSLPTHVQLHCPLRTPCFGRRCSRAGCR